MANLSYQEQLQMIDALVENLNDLRGLLGTIRDGYSQNITSSERMGLADEYIATLREREARLHQTMDDLERLIERQKHRLDSQHRDRIHALIVSANS